MLDFALLPPEVTSARMYSGAGSGPLMAAATAWDALAAQLETVSRGYSVIVSGLLDEGWSGPASVAMAGAAAPYAAWAATTGTQAAQTAGQARAAAAAYETAHAAVVPPAMVQANRIQLAQLVAANILGQNTAEIALTEAAYAQMWAQDALAMFGYATSSSAATGLTPFAEPQPTTNAAGGPAQAAAATHVIGAAANSQLSQAMAAVPQQLHALSTGAAQGSTPSGWERLLTAAGNINTITGPASLAEATSRTATSAGSFGAGIFRSILQAQGAVAKALPELAPAATTGAVLPDSAGLRSVVLAGAGQAEPIGGLSVPPRWAAAVPAPTTFAEPPWLSEAELAETNTLAGSPMAGMGPMAATGAMAGMLARPTVSSVLRVAPRRFKMPRPSSGG